MPTPRISIVIPTLDEAATAPSLARGPRLDPIGEAGTIRATLAALAPLRERGHEVIVVDGGSQDDTARLAAHGADAVLTSARGRGVQLATGAAAARGEALWFLHADSLPPPEADRLIVEALAHHPWGRFDVRLSGRHPVLRAVERLMNLRSRLTGIATGDQGIFVRRAAYAAVGGMPVQPLMEDIELSRRLKRLGRPACLRERITTSSRRWEAHGVIATILLMWRLRFAYWRGTDPAQLAQRYGKSA